MLRLGLVLLLFVAVITAQKVDKKKCGECDRLQCDEPVNCLAGVVRDECGCCHVCARSLYQVCPHRDVSRPIDDFWLPDCGTGLECLIRNDLEEGDAMEALCFCEKTDAVCGSDGVTYENVCALREAASQDQDAKITKVRDMPCDAPPTIVSPPEPTKNKTGSNIAFICEAQGFPIPTIEWTWTRVDGKTLFLPSDDLRMSVNMRGGPERFEITGWLQIMDLHKDHEGDYTCVAQNEHGMDKSVARLNVKNGQNPSEEKQKKSLNDIVRGNDEP